MGLLKSKKILFIDNFCFDRDIILTVIESQFENQIVEVDSGEEAIKILTNDSEFALIICDFGFSDAGENAFYSFLKKQGNKVSVILINNSDIGNYSEFSNFYKDNALNDSFSRPIMERDIIDKVTLALGLNVSAEAGAKKYFKVNIARFIEVNSNKMDIFIKLSEDKFIKVVDKNNEYDKGAIAKYLNRNITFFYLTNEGLVSYLAQVAAYSAAGAIGQLDIDMDLQLTSVEQIHECVQALGINESTVKLATSVVALALVTIESNKKLEYVYKLLKSGTNYISLHAQLTSYIACSLASKMEWGTTPVLNSLTFAALFQNISLSNSKHAMIQNIDSDTFKNISEDEQRLIRNHVFKSVEMLQDLPKFNEDAHKAIINHHERPNGKGFPRGLMAAQIPPLCCVFILASQFAHELIVRGSSRDKIQSIINDFEKIYSHGNFDRPFYEFKKMFYE